MTFDETLEYMRREYFAAMAATCQDDMASSLLDYDKVDQFPTFYEFLLTRGFNRFQLSAYGIGKDIK